MSCKYICGEYEVTFRLSRLIDASVRIYSARLGAPLYTDKLPVPRPSRRSLLNGNVKEKCCGAYIERETRHPRCPSTR